MCLNPPHVRGGLVGHGEHVAAGFNFDLPYEVPESATAQAAWRRCNKCGVMFFDGAPDKGVCAAGDAHEAQGYNFTLPHDIAPTANMQATWRYCVQCHALFFDGFAEKGACPGNIIGSSGGVTGGERHPIYGGHAAAGFDFVLPYQGPSPSGGGISVTLSGAVWVVSLTHQQSEGLEGLLGTIAGATTRPPLD